MGSASMGWAGLSSALLCLAACSGSTEPGTDGGAVRDATAADGYVATDSGRAVDGGPGLADAGTGRDGGTSSGTGCAGHTYAFCEDFESAAPGSLPVRLVGGLRLAEGGRSRSERGRAHSGARSLRSAVRDQRPAPCRALARVLGPRRAGRTGAASFTSIKTPVFLPTGGSRRSQHVRRAALVERREPRRRHGDRLVRAHARRAPVPLQPPRRLVLRGQRVRLPLVRRRLALRRVAHRRDDQSFEFFYDGDEVTALRFSYGAGDRRARMEAFAGHRARLAQLPDAGHAVRLVLRRPRARRRAHRLRLTRPGCRARVRVRARRAAVSYRFAARMRRSAGAMISPMSVR